MAGKTPLAVLNCACMRLKIIPEFNIIFDGTGSANPMFQYRVLCNDMETFGTGNSKKEAKHAAALEMLKLFKEEYRSCDDELVELLAEYFNEMLTLNSDEVVCKPRGNCITELLKLCHTHVLPLPEYQVIEELRYRTFRRYTVQCKLSKCITEMAVCRSKKQAKQLSAQLMIDRLATVMKDLNILNDDVEDNTNEDARSGIRCDKKEREEGKLEYGIGQTAVKGGSRENVTEKEVNTESGIEIEEARKIIAKENNKEKDEEICGDNFSEKLETEVSRGGDDADRLETVETDAIIDGELAGKVETLSINEEKIEKVKNHVSTDGEKLEMQLRIDRENIGTQRVGENVETYGCIGNNDIQKIESHRSFLLDGEKVESRECIDSENVDKVETEGSVIGENTENLETPESIDGENVENVEINVGEKTEKVGTVRDNKRKEMGGEKDGREKKQRTKARKINYRLKFKDYHLVSKIDSAFLYDNKVDTLKDKPLSGETVCMNSVKSLLEEIMNNVDIAYLDHYVCPENSNEFCISSVLIQTSPPWAAFGKGATKEEAENEAALKMLLFVRLLKS